MSAVSEFVAEFGQAFSHLVVWAFLLGVVACLLQSVVKSHAWRNLLAAAFPGAKVRWRDAYGAYLVKSGAGIFLPMHGDDAVRVTLMKDRIEGASTAAVAATAGVETLSDVLLTAVLLGASVWLGASLIDLRSIEAHPAGPAIVAALIVGAIVSAAVAVRRRARGLGHELKQGVAIFKHRGAYTRTVLGWHVVALMLELATLYLLLTAFGFRGTTLASVVLIRTAQRLTVSLPGFLETGSQQAMIVAILTAGGVRGRPGVGLRLRVEGHDGRAQHRARSHRRADNDGTAARAKPHRVEPASQEASGKRRCNPGDDQRAQGCRPCRGRIGLTEAGGAAVRRSGPVTVCRNDRGRQPKEET